MPSVIKLVALLFVHISVIVGNQFAQFLRCVLQILFLFHYPAEEWHEASIVAVLILVDRLQGLQKLWGRCEEVEGGYDKTFVSAVCHADCRLKVRLMTQEGCLKSVFNSGDHQGSGGSSSLCC